MGELKISKKDVFINNKVLSKSDAKKLENACKKVAELLQKDGFSSPSKAKVLEDFLSIAEPFSVDVRSKLYDILCENFAQNPASIGEDFSFLALENLPKSPVKVSFEGDTFIIKTPHTLKRKNEKSNVYDRKFWSLKDYAVAEIIKWQAENPEEKIALNSNFVGKKLIFIIKRKATKYNRNVHCDNDNIENSRIQNAMYEAIGISDNCLGSDYYSCFRLVDNEADCGTEFILTRAENLQKYV